jgi:hypothetical protein
MPEGSLERRTMRKVLWRIMPLLLPTYFVSITDRTNLGIAAIQMNQDLGLVLRSMAGARGSSSPAMPLSRSQAISVNRRGV